MNSSESAWRLVLVAAGLGVIAVLHLVTDPMAHPVHDVLFKATYLPLVLAGWWFHLRGGLAASGAMSVFALVHWFGQLSAHAEHGGHSSWSLAVDILLYNVVAFTTGLLSQRRDQALARAESQARELESNARALLQAEEAMKRSERLRALGELAAGMAHEIRNPLGGIRGAAEVLVKPETKAEARAEFGKLLDDEVTRLDRVVANFLDFARPPAAEIAHVRTAEVVEAVALLLTAEARRRGVSIDRAVPPNLEVRADPALLRQILLNLCLNAVQAQEGGGVVRVVARRDGDLATIDVEDHGPGVPPAIRDRLFDPYVSGRVGGSGLGLPIAARLAETMGGRVELVSTGETGSVFRTTLPAA